MSNNKYIYRYRPYSILTLKELIYEELYFAYSNELNDPFDLVFDLFIKKEDGYILEYLFNVAFKVLNHNSNPTEQMKSISKEMVKQILVDDLHIKDALDEQFKDFLGFNFANKFNSPLEFSRFYRYFYNILDNLIPSNLSSISFSSSPYNPVLWSIYANSHTGFCLIFNPENDHLNIREPGSKDFFKCPVTKITYSEDKSIDLSILFTKESVDEDSISGKNYIEEIKKKGLLTKNPNWIHEDERRIFGDYYYSYTHLHKEESRDSIYQRTVHYDPKQLIGVILGLGLSTNQKYEIENILSKKEGPITIYKAVSSGNDLKIAWDKLVADSPERAFQQSLQLDSAP